MVLVLGTARRLLRLGVPLAILGGCALVLLPLIETLDSDRLIAAWSQIAVADWVLSLVFTLVSFLAIGQYDLIAHRQLDTRIPAEQARQSGIVAIALSQTIGFGFFTATLIRWRLLRGLGPGVAVMVTAFVSLAFLLALAALTSLACIFLVAPQYFATISYCVLPVLLGALCLMLRHPRVTCRGMRIALPGLRVISAATCWAALDIATAALALWLLIPESARPEFATFLPAFCLALSAGLLSGTPAGAGPFELVLLALCAAGMPAETETSALLVAIMGFRLVYFALPACLAAAAMLVLRPKEVFVWRDPEPPALATAPRAETGVIRQNGGQIERLGATHAALWPTGQALVAMFDPFAPPTAGFFAALVTRAHGRNRFALIYKSGARTALAARRAGWVCVHTADDAIIDAQRFDLASPHRAGLRRKLRKAERAGVTVRDLQARDLDQLRTIDRAWQAAQGRARGGSMGRFCPDYIDGQRVLVAEAGRRIVGFVSLQTCQREWAVDLMRQGQDAPDGTMHALVHAAIVAAGRAGVAELSLAAVPACPDPSSAIWRLIAVRLVDLAGGVGLRQFKSSFAPRWKPLYVAAPSRLALCIAGLDVAREIFLPADGTYTQPADPHQALKRPHEKDEIYELAPEAAA